MPSLTSTPPIQITKELVRSVLNLWQDDLPPTIVEQTQLQLLNVLALTVSAARHPAVDAIVRLQEVVGGTVTCVVPGRSELLDLSLAPLAIGVAAHLDDFDDTHLATVIHPSAAALASALPVGVLVEASGRDLLQAFAWGCEVQLRVGIAMSPSHYDAGWHITGTAGAIGCAAAAGLLLGLDETSLGWAIGIAASSTVGHRQAFGTMTKPLHPGKAAANGVLAARLAHNGFTGPSSALEAPRGYFEVLAREVSLGVVLDGLGERWHFGDDAVKPYPCGIVAHPLIDAGLELRQLGIDPSRVTGVRVKCNPLVPELMGNLDPRDGLQARFSAVHGVAVALLDGQVGLPSYEYERVRAEDAVAMRALVSLEPEISRERDSAMAVAELDDGSTIAVNIPHARGSIARPMLSEEIMTKTEALLTPVLGAAWQGVPDAVADLPEAEDLVRLCMAATVKGGDR